MRKPLKPVFLWGGAGQARVLSEFLPDIGYRVKWIFDNNLDAQVSIKSAKYLGGWKEFLRFSKKHKRVGFLVAIGREDRGKERYLLQLKITKLGFTPIIAIHPTAFVAKTAKIGEGSQILAHASICAEAKIGLSCIVNTGAQVDHDSVLENGVHIMPGAIVTGEVYIEKYATIGSGAIILPSIRIGEGSIVGAGAVVTKDVKPYSVVVGIPAREIKKVNKASE